MNISNLALMGLFVVAGCSATADDHAAASENDIAAPGLVTLDENESQLEAAFNSNSGKAQLVVVLSPT